MGCTVLEASKQMGDSDLSVYISPTQEILDVFLDFKTPTCKKDTQSICGMAAPLKHWLPGLMLEFPSLQKLCTHNVQFYRNRGLEKELSTMKATIKSHMKLPPLDTAKDVVTCSNYWDGLHPGSVQEP